MFLMLTLMLSTAQATEIGTERPLGAGVSVGFNQGITGKYWLSEQLAVSAMASPPVGVLFANLQAEYLFVDFFNTDWGRLDLYGWAGPSATIAFNGSAHLIGASGGAGVTLRFHKFPLEVFSQVGVSGGLTLGSSAPPIGLPAAMNGARWYF